MFFFATYYRSSEWNSIPSVERERMGLVFRDDGELMFLCYILQVIRMEQYTISRERKDGSSVQR